MGGGSGQQPRLVKHSRGEVVAGAAARHGAPPTHLQEAPQALNHHVHEEAWRPQEEEPARHKVVRALLLLGVVWTHLGHIGSISSRHA